MTLEPGLEGREGNEPSDGREASRERPPGEAPGGSGSSRKAGQVVGGGT